MSAAAKIQKLYNEASNRDKKCKELVAQEPNKGKVINPFRPSRPSIDLKGDLYNGLKELCEADEQEKTQMGHLHVSKVQKAKGAEEKSSSDSEQSDDETDLSNSDSEQSDDETEKSSSDSEQSDDETDHLSSDSDDEKPNDSNSDPKQLGDDEKPNDSNSDPKQLGDDEKPNDLNSDPKQLGDDEKIDKITGMMIEKITEGLAIPTTVANETEIKEEDVQNLHNAVKREVTQRQDGVLTRLFISTPIYSRILMALMKGVVCGMMAATINFEVMRAYGILPVAIVPVASIAFVAGFCITMLSEYTDILLHFFTTSPNATISKLLDVLSSIPLLGRLLRMLRSLFALVAKHGAQMIRFFIIFSWYNSLYTFSPALFAGVIGAQIFYHANGSVGKTVREMMHRVAQSMQEYFGPFWHDRVFSVLLLSLRGEYGSAAMQVSTLVGGVMSVLCGDTNLSCRKARLLLAFPGAAAALYSAAGEIVRMARIMTNTRDPQYLKYLKCCMRGLPENTTEEDISILWENTFGVDIPGIDKTFAKYHKSLNLSEEDVSKLNMIRQGKLHSELKNKQQLTRLLNKANRKQQQIYHPDKHKGSPNSKGYAEALQKSTDLNNAHDKLMEMYSKRLEKLTTPTPPHPNSPHPNSPQPQPQGGSQKSREEEPKSEKIQKPMRNRDLSVY